MATTTLFVELIVIGAHGFIWLALLYMSLSGTPPSLSLDEVSSALIILPTLVICYVLGIILDGLYRYGFLYVEHVLRRKAIKRAFNREVQKEEIHNEWTPIRNYMIKSTGSERELYAYFRHRIRILRASAFNFLFSAIGLFLFCSLQESIEIKCSGILIAALVVLSVLSCIVWWRITRGWAILSCSHYKQELMKKN